MPTREQVLERRLVDIKTAAERYSVHPMTIRRSIADGRLTGYKFGRQILRVDLAELDAAFAPIATAGNVR